MLSRFLWPHFKSVVLCQDGKLIIGSFNLGRGSSSYWFRLFQLDDTKRLADAEQRDRATLLGKFRNLEADLESLRSGREIGLNISQLRTN